jgi:16S rRNA (guanine527-N7)-methyltransferase
LSGAGSAEAALAAYRAELARWGERMNLVGSTDDAALDRHFEDSLFAAGEIPAGARVADLGSGAGFPGLPIAIARPDVHVTLVEIREKRVAFLRHVVRTLGLDVEVRQTSLATPPAGERFELVLLRAVAAPEGRVSSACAGSARTGRSGSGRGRRRRFRAPGRSHSPPAAPSCAFVRRSFPVERPDAARVRSLARGTLS